MKKMINVWLDQLTEFNHVAKYIDMNLDVLKDNARTANFNDKQVRRQYQADVLFLKQFFERAEYLARLKKDAK